LDYIPTFTTTSIFTHGHFGFCTHFDHHLHFHTWPIRILHLLWPPLQSLYMATSDSTPSLTTTSHWLHAELHNH
jgi:hypothetical protein